MTGAADNSPIRLINTGQDIDHLRLARSVGSDQPEDLPFIDMETYVVESGESGKDLAGAFDLAVGADRSVLALEQEECPSQSCFDADVAIQPNTIRSTTHALDHGS